MHKLFITLTLVLMLFAPSVFAEDLPVIPEDAPALLEQPKVADPFAEEIPDEYIEEAAAVQRECEGGYVLSQYFDCECRALKYLEQRVLLGATADPGLIEMNIKKECRDSTRAAGAEYNRCLINYADIDRNRNPEELCECFANTYSELMDRYKPSVLAKTMVDVRTRALQTCVNPAYARQKYGTYMPPKRP
jgi:hypothetical protein